MTNNRFIFLIFALAALVPGLAAFKGCASAAPALDTRLGGPLSVTAQFDVLDWMTQDQPGQHLTGSSTSMWTVNDSAHSNLYWLKGAGGYPWDVKSYDSGTIYDWITEVDWSDPHTYKRHLGPSGKGYPLSARFLTYTVGVNGARLSQINIPSSGTNFEIHSSCSNFTSSNLGYARTEVWGPFNETLGGDLPNSLQTLHLVWLWGCDSSFGQCSTKEVFTLAKAWGNVRWQNFKLTNGAYSLVQTSLKNVLAAGTIAPVHPCWP